MQQSLKEFSKSLHILVKTRLWLQVILALILGILVGLLIGPSVGWLSPKASMSIGSWLALPGQIFLAVIQMIVIPLVISSIIIGITSSQNLDTLKSLGIRAVLFFVSTTVLAIIIGISLTYLFEPGNYVDVNSLQIQETSVSKTDVDKSSTVTDQILGLIPKNPMSSMLNAEMLQLVILAIILGIAMVSMQREKAQPVLQFLNSLQEICLTIIQGIMRLAPIAVFGLIAQLAAQTGVSTLIGLSAYVFCVLLGLFILLIFYIILIAIFTKIPVRHFIRSVKDVQLLAFSTSSSMAVMPLSIKVLEESLSVKKHIAQFMIPLGATINMNGTALYQGVATIFLAQVFGVDLGIDALVLIVITAVAASIGSPATPGVGIVILSMILSSSGIPLAGIGLLLGVDRILDMSRTAVNVTGDIVAAAVIQRSLGKDA